MVVTNKSGYKRGKNPNSLKNLHPFVKGVTPNPTGRPPKADCLKECIEAELAKKDKTTGQTKEQLLAGVLVDKALTGDARAMELVLQYTCAKPDQGNIPPGGISINLISRIPRPERRVDDTGH